MQYHGKNSPGTKKKKMENGCVGATAANLQAEPLDGLARVKEGHESDLDLGASPVPARWCLLQARHSCLIQLKCGVQAMGV